jgi:hypothetical protein
MVLSPVKRMMRRLMAPGCFIGLAVPLMAGPSGPTLHFDYGNGGAPANPLGEFMYFVPLISPELVTVSTNAGNTQCARVVSFHCRTNGNSFHSVCEFEIVGAGLQRNVFDHARAIERHEKSLQAGKPMAHQLSAISVQGSGSGSVETEGTLSNSLRTVTEVRLRFNSHGHTSPVSISLEDICYRDGAIHFENETVARVNTLSFLQKSGLPKMEVTLASVKRKAAGNGLWRNFVGGLKGVAANLFLPPLTVAADGHQAMLDFGLALTLEKETFTFPFATRLKDGPTTDP